MSAPKITGLAETNAIVSSVERTGAATVKDQLVELATKFKDAAKVIDPSILGAWFGYDVDEGRLCFVDFDRAEKPVGLESGIEILFRQWKGWRDMSYEGLTQQECDALYEKYAAVRDQLLELHPLTAREMAMQIIAETDENDSDWREEFFDKVNALAGNIVTRGFK
jgi:hypothetical protein